MTTVFDRLAAIATAPQAGAGVSPSGLPAVVRPRARHRYEGGTPAEPMWPAVAPSPEAASQPPQGRVQTVRTSPPPPVAHTAPAPLPGPSRVTFPVAGPRMAVTPPPGVAAPGLLRSAPVPLQPPRTTTLLSPALTARLSPVWPPLPPPTPTPVSPRHHLPAAAEAGQRQVAQTPPTPPLLPAARPISAAWRVPRPVAPDEVVRLVREQLVPALVEGGVLAPTERNAHVEDASTADAADSAVPPHQVRQATVRVDPVRTWRVSNSPVPPPVSSPTPVPAAPTVAVSIGNVTVSRPAAPSPPAIARQPRARVSDIDHGAYLARRRLAP